MKVKIVPSSELTGSLRAEHYIKTAHEKSAELVESWVRAYRLENIISLDGKAMSDLRKRVAEAIEKR